MTAKTAKTILTEYMQSVVRCQKGRELSTEEHSNLMLDALRSAGWAVVPVEPTPAMEDAYLLLAYNDEGPALDVGASEAWQAMLKAAQEDSRE